MGNYAFIDNQNLNLGVQKFGWKMNWRKLHEYLQQEHHVTKAYMFIGYMPEHVELYEQMHELGFLVVLKPTLEMYKNPAGESGPADVEKKTVKGNIDVELVMYAVKEMPNYQQAVVVSGDGDFYSLVEYLEQRGKLKALLTPNRQYSTLLKPYEKYIINMESLKQKLRYIDQPKSSRPNR